MFCVFLNLFISCLSTESVYGLSTHAVIGNYSELNSKDCGINRLTNDFDDKCFKWHKKTITSLIAGRNATLNEVPWIVQIILVSSRDDITAKTFRCTGSVIGNYWVLTAAHCLQTNESDKYDLYFGYHSYGGQKTYKVKSTEIHRHPNFSRKFNGANINDIGLVKLQASISYVNSKIKEEMKKIGQNPNLHEVRPICLPKEDIVNTVDEYVLSTGWGQIDRKLLPLQMGYRKIYSDPYPSIAPSLKLERDDVKGTILTEALDNQTHLCKGDSGGPLWQMYLARSVIIGVFSFGQFSVVNSVCQAPKDVQWFTRVSLHINWIKNVTKLK